MGVELGDAVTRPGSWKTMAGDLIRDISIRRQSDSEACRIIIVEASAMRRYWVPGVHRPTAIPQLEDEARFNETAFKVVVEEEVLLRFLVVHHTVPTLHVA
jgi:hypothetical protein